MKNALILALLAIASTLGAQTTKINATKLVAPSGTNNQFLITNNSGAVAWANAAALLVGGTGISISGNTVTNTDPDQSTTNEIQALSAADGSGSDKQINLSLSGGTITFSPGTGIALARTSNTITISATASAPTVTIQRYEEVVATATSTITVSGFTPGANDTLVYVDGVYQDIGTGEDATLSGSVYTFSQQLAVGQKVVVRKVTVN